MTRDSSPFDVWIHPETLAKLNHYATEAYDVGQTGTEIGGLARVQIEDTDVYVVDVHMFPQRASGATFDIDPEDINEFTRTLIKEGRLDELHEWCSIVHSHPKGMGAQMSSVDVDAIKRFAAEEDAFSLIISTSDNADSTNLLMHYCTNIRGQKHLISNMPVNKCYSQERLNLGSEVAKFILDKLDFEYTEGDRKRILKECTTLVCDKLPDMFEAELNELKQMVKEDVRALIKTNAHTFGFSGGTSKPEWEKNPDGWSQREDGTWVKEHNASTSLHDGGLQTLWDDADYAEYYAGGYQWFDDDKEEFEKHRSLVMIANGIDPVSGNRTVSKNQQKKAKKRLKKLADRYHANKDADTDKNLSQEDRIPKVGDYLIVTEDAAEAVRAQCIDDDEWALAQSLMIVPGRVRHIRGETINVNGLDFWMDELRYATEDEINIAKECDTVV